MTNVSSKSWRLMGGRPSAPTRYSQTSRKGMTESFNEDNEQQGEPLLTDGGGGLKFLSLSPPPPSLAPAAALS